MKGLHPGFGILDEPLQQNPDKKHRDLVINFLTSESSSEFARATTVQTVVITWLREDELQRLADADLRLLNASARISSIACCHRSRPPGRGWRDAERRERAA